MKHMLELATKKKSESFKNSAHILHHFVHIAYIYHQELRHYHARHTNKT